MKSKQLLSEPIHKTHDHKINDKTITENIIETEESLMR